MACAHAVARLRVSKVTTSLGLVTLVSAAPSPSLDNYPDRARRMPLQQLISTLQSKLQPKRSQLCPSVVPANDTQHLTEIVALWGNLMRNRLAIGALH